MNTVDQFPLETPSDASTDATARDVRRSSPGRRVSGFLTGWLGSRGRVRPARVVVACSGGPDSTALLLLVWALRAELALDVHVVCVDHQLRPAARAEAALVVEVARRLGLSAESIAVACAPGPSQMATARTARYDALARAAQRVGADAVLVAHTQQDQAETMLMRWLAGAGLLGLCGMAAGRDLPVLGETATAVPLLRPLLTTSRAELEALLAATTALVAPLPLQDPSNVDRHYQRSRLRHDLLPQLRREQPQLDSRLLQLAAQLRDDSDYLEQQAEDAYQALRGSQSADGEHCLTLPLGAAAALPPALFARVIMRASGGGLGQPHIAAVRSLCTNTQGTQALDLPGGRRVERRYAQLCFLTHTAPRYSATHQPSAQTLPGCGRYTFWHGTLDLHWETPPSPLPELLDPADPANPASLTDPVNLPGAAETTVVSALGPAARGCCQARLLLPASAFPLTLRPPRPGDRIRNYGSGGTRKVSDLLIDLKVPRFARAGIALLCAGDELLWVVGHRPATPLPVAAAAAPAAGVRVLIARFTPHQDCAA